MNRKGYFFTLTVIIVISLVALVFTLRQDPGYSSRAAIENQRLVEDERFLSAAQDDVAVALRVAAYRAFLSIDEDNLRSDGYLPGFDATFEELVLNGTDGGTASSFLVGSSLADWESSVRTLAGRLGLDFSLEDLEVEAFQDDPWTVQVRLTGTVVLEDPSLEARWESSFLASASLPVTAFNDPLYTVGTAQRAFRRISAVPAAPSFPADIPSLISSGSYFATPKGPSFLMRIRGDLSPGGAAGIESLVDVEVLAAVDIERSGSIIDSHYLGAPELVTCPVPGQPAWAVLAASRTEYGLTC
jgi:hypothetical protein